MIVLDGQITINVEPQRRNDRLSDMAGQAICGTVMTQQGKYSTLNYSTDFKTRYFAYR